MCPPGVSTLPERKHVGDMNTQRLNGLPSSCVLTFLSSNVAESYIHSVAWGPYMTKTNLTEGGHAQNPYLTYTPLYYADRRLIHYCA